MLNNNLSNRQAPIIVFDIDSLLFKEKEKKAFDKVKDAFKSSEKRYLEQDVNNSFVSTLDRVWTRHNVSIYLVTFNYHGEENDLHELLWRKHVPYTRLEQVQEWESMRHFTNYMYFFSDNEELLSYISNKYSMKLDKLWEVLG